MMLKEALLLLVLVASVHPAVLHAEGRTGHRDSRSYVQSEAQPSNVNNQENKVCLGTSDGFDHSGDTASRYDNLKQRYTNCTLVDGNLEITFLDEGKNYDLSFLSSIREVTGYVLIVAVYADHLNLSNLKIIRGYNLFESAGSYYSLYIALNFKPNTTVGLKELQLVSLKEIQNGDVLLAKNNMLCFEDSVKWQDILVGEGAKVKIVNNSTVTCGECHPGCEIVINGQTKRHCWGAGPDMCQTLTRMTCNPQCESRCHGPGPDQCCHAECSGGCSGPTNQDCVACKNFAVDGKCVPYCPQPLIYDDEKFALVPNPNVKYAYGAMCVNQCPSNLLVQHGVCVRECSANTRAIEGKCVDCDGPCPKTCEGTQEDFLNAGNIEDFRGCVVVEGDISILAASFMGDPFRNLEPITVQDLEVFSTVQEITGILEIEANSPSFTNLHFFHNLKYIRGHPQQRNNYGTSLHIYGTSLRSLNLVSLNKIENGNVLIAANPDLCYVDSISWRNLTSSPSQRVIITQNKDAAQCSAR